MSSRRSFDRNTPPPLSPNPFDIAIEQLEHDFPPASDPHSSNPYPNRLARLNRALQSTEDLVAELGQRMTSINDRASRPLDNARRRRYSIIEIDDLPNHVAQSSEFSSSLRDSRDEPPGHSEAVHSSRPHLPAQFGLERPSTIWSRNVTEGDTSGWSMSDNEHADRPLARRTSDLDQDAQDIDHRPSIPLYRRSLRFGDRHGRPRLPMGGSRRWARSRDTGHGEAGAHLGWIRQNMPRAADDNVSSRIPSISTRLAKRQRLAGPQINWLAKPPITYGHFGQVEPGHLRMELISCDGGELMDHRSPRMYLGFQNVLKADHSVYCSSNDRISILLRHEDTTSFCIDKLHIVGPEHGFDAPVSQGVVFIAMNLEDLKAYQERPLHARRAHDNSHSAPREDQDMQRVDSLRLSDRLSLSEALRDPEIAEFHYNQASGAQDVASLPEHEVGYTGPHTTGVTRARWNARSDDGTPLMPNNAATTHSYDEVVAQDDKTPPEVTEYRWSRQHRRREYPGLIPNQYYPLMSSTNQNRLSLANRRSSPLESNQKHAPVLPYDDPKITFVPFNIQDGKHSITITFEPQVSGRFILLKLSAGGRSNVDVQNIVVSGFAGPRFFPAQQCR